MIERDVFAEDDDEVLDRPVLPQRSKRAGLLRAGRHRPGGLRQNTGEERPQLTYEFMCPPALCCRRSAARQSRNIMWADSDSCVTGT